MTDLEPERGLAIYLSRMKIEETFRDVKHLLHLDKVMNKQQAAMEKMVALVLLAFSIGLLVGEELRDQVHPSCGQKSSIQSKFARRLDVSGKCQGGKLTILCSIRPNTTK